MDNERDQHTSYRVELLDDPKDGLTYHVTTYAPSGVSGSLEYTKEETLRVDLVPSWVLTSIEMLNMASVNEAGAIPFFGTRSGNIYWFQASQVYNA